MFLVIFGLRSYFCLSFPTLLLPVYLRLLSDVEGVALLDLISYWMKPLFGAALTERSAENKVLWFSFLGKTEQRIYSICSLTVLHKIWQKHVTDFTCRHMQKLWKFLKIQTMTKCKELNLTVPQCNVWVPSWTTGRWGRAAAVRAEPPTYWGASLSKWSREENNGAVEEVQLL